MSLRRLEVHISVLDLIRCWPEHSSLGARSPCLCSDLVFALVYTVILFALVLVWFFRSILSW